MKNLHKIFFMNLPIILLFITIGMNCSKKEPSPKTVDLLTIAGFDAIYKSNTCTIIGIDGGSLYFRVTYLSQEARSIPELNGQGSRFLRVRLNAGDTLEIRSTTTNLTTSILSYFTGENCLFDARESPTNTLSNVRPVGVTDFTTISNTANYQAFQTSKSGYYNIRLQIDADPSLTFSDISANYK